MTRSLLDPILGALLGAVTVTTAACQAKPPSEADAGPAANASAHAPASATPGGMPSGPSAPSAPGAIANLVGRPSCRAVSVKGDVRAFALAGDAGVNLVTVQSEIPENAWLTLGREARLAAKDPRTSRETIFTGPGRVRACAGHREESWLASGGFESEPGAGESPGAEEWVVTPLAVFRFSGGKTRVTVRPEETTVDVSSGVVFAWIAADAHAPPESEAGAGAEGSWQRLTGTALRITAAAKESVETTARASLDRCAAVAHRSEELTRALLAPRGDRGGEVSNPDAAAQGQGQAPDPRAAIAEQVSTRELARAACAVAGVRVEALTPASRGELEERLHEAEQAWTALPTTAAVPPAPRSP